MKRIGAFAPLIALALLVIISAFLLTRPNVSQPTITTGDIGRAQPTYAMARLGGGPMVTSDDLRGRAHLVNVFASWCVPCRAEHPVLLALKNQGVPIVGVAYKDHADATARFLGELGDPFSAVALDPDGRLGLDFGVAGVPETFVVGPDGRIRAIHRGPLTPDVIDSEIMPALNAR